MKHVESHIQEPSGGERPAMKWETILVNIHIRTFDIARTPAVRRLDWPLVALCAAMFLSLSATGSASAQPMTVTPDAVVDLSTRAGIEAAQGSWRYSDATIVEVEHRDAGPDKKPSAAPNRTHDIRPRAGGSDFDDSAWPIIEPESLTQRRTHGRLAFGWYRLRITLPARIASLDVRGTTVALELVVDDYAEIWVNGRLPQVLGQSGGPLVAGWNTPNRVVLTDDAQPGQTIQIAIFAANGPLSDPPANYVWIRSATLDFYRPGRFSGAQQVPLKVDRRDPALDAIVSAGATLERLATGFIFTEGPVRSDEGYLLFSDPNANRIYRWAPDGQVSLFRTKSGYAGPDIGEYRQAGSNGLAFDRDGRLTVCEHGRRRVVRIEKNGDVTVVADRYEGKRLNSPNDLVYRSDGALFFTDPPFGLPKVHDDPRRELPHSGVYCVMDGTVKLVSKDLSGPNGLAFSPDEKYLYAGNWDTTRKVVMRYEIGRDGAASGGSVFFEMTAAPGEDAIDGIKVDGRGNLFVSGPGGLWVISPEGRHLGTLSGPEHPHNLAWGDADRRTLYLTALSSIYRLSLDGRGASAPGASN